jgi:hypothetical protein
MLNTMYSAVSIMVRLGLDSQGIVVRFSAMDKPFFLFEASKAALGPTQPRSKLAGMWR